MRMSDWSSDVCSSDLIAARAELVGPELVEVVIVGDVVERGRRLARRHKCLPRFQIWRGGQLGGGRGGQQPGGDHPAQYFPPPEVDAFRRHITFRQFPVVRVADQPGRTPARPTMVATTGRTVWWARRL